MEDNFLRREKNYREYLLLIKDPHYLCVAFDQLSGGVSAVHKEHCYDKQLGPFGCRRGQYELDAIDVLRRNGFSAILESEYPKGKRVKVVDARINGVPAEIKTIENIGRWSVRTKIHTAIKQGAEVLVLYYPSRSLFLESRIFEGWNYNSFSKKPIKLNRILAVVEEEVIEMLKPPG